MSAGESERRGREWGAGWRSPEAEARATASLEYCWRFFVGEAEAQKAARKLVGILEAEGVPYAIIGALALNEYGHRRATVDVDLVMREEDLQAFKARWLGRGYSERVPGTGKLFDTEFGVDVDVLSTGRFPGDDKPKPISFPRGWSLPTGARTSPTSRTSSAARGFVESSPTRSTPGCGPSSSRSGRKSPTATRTTRSEDTFEVRWRWHTQTSRSFA